MYDFRGKTALVTGASSGIGEAFAAKLAERGANVVLVARSAAKLQGLADALTARYGVSAAVIAADLARADGVAATVREVQRLGLSVDLLVNNAGFGSHGRFETLEAGREREQVILNVVALAQLTRAFLPEMVARGAGAVLNVASTAAFQPDPYMATYGATKAFVLSFSEALWAENRRTGVNVLAVCAGPTATNFSAVVGTDEVLVGRVARAERVAREALQALSRRRSVVVTGGLQNRLTTLLPRLLPRRTTARIVERILRPKGASQRTVRPHLSA